MLFIGNFLLFFGIFWQKSDKIDVSWATNIKESVIS